MDFNSSDYRRGMGNWDAWGDDIAPIVAAAQGWKLALEGIEKPWLCWNVNDDWCLLQQHLVTQAGWTPVVGFDPRVGAPARTLPHSVVVDFNRALNLPVLYPHFPLEFVFLFSERMAFWHSDLLLSDEKMFALGQLFSSIPDGVTAAVNAMGYKDWLGVGKRRYWELIGCTTRSASLDQFEKGCGWWIKFQMHKNRKKNASDKNLYNYYWDHGSGIYYWKKRYQGQVLDLPEKDFVEGHFTQIKFSGYQRASPNNEFRDLSKDLSANFALLQCAQKMRISHHLV